jgi:hypothetical protein
MRKHADNLRQLSEMAVFCWVGVQDRTSRSKERGWGRLTDDLHLADPTIVSMLSTNLKLEGREGRTVAKHRSLLCVSCLSVGGR